MDNRTEEQTDTAVSAEKMAEWAELAEKATLEPWFAGKAQEMGDGSGRHYITIGPFEPNPATGNHYEDSLADVHSENRSDVEFEANAAFIAASREALPALLAAHKAQAAALATAEAERDAMRAEVERLRGHELEAAQVIMALNGGDEMQNLMKLNNQLVTRAETAEADAARLRADVNRIKDIAKRGISHGLAEGMVFLREILRRAEQALGGGK